MNRKRMMKTWILLILIFCIAQAKNYGKKPVMAASVQKSRTMADGSQWKYKTINGKLYKRLYNVIKHRWESDWTPV